MPPRAINSGTPAPNDPGWTHFVETCFGGGAVLLTMDPRGASLVANDISGQLMNFWRVIADFKALQQFHVRVATTPFSEQRFHEAVKFCELQTQNTLQQINVDAAVHFFVKYRQSRQAAGDSFATLSKRRTRQGMNEQVAAWLSSVEGLAEAHEHLKQVAMLNKTLFQVIASEDTERTLFYIDTPYLPETRTTQKAYEHEMTYDEHEQLLKQLGGIQGRFLLSGYDSELYRTYASQFGWRAVSQTIDNKASSSKQKELKTEWLWMNYDVNGNKIQPPTK